MIKIMKEIDEKDVTGFLKECLDKVKTDGKVRYFVEKLVPFNDFSKKVEITLNVNMVEPPLAKIWLRNLYGETIYYDSKNKLFEIGGYELEPISARTISGLMKKLEKPVKIWK